MRFGTGAAFCCCIMLNLIPSNELIELSSKNWWPEKKDARHTKNTANAEEYLPLERLNQPEAAVPPETVYFVIELA